MEVHYNLAASLIGSLFGILALFSVFINSHLVRERKEYSYNRWMAYMIVICLVGCVSEMIFELVNGVVFPYSREINITVKTINHFESICAGFFFIGCMRTLTYQDEKRWPTYLRVITAVVCGGGALMLLANLFTGIAFTVSPDNHYARGPLGQLGLIISLLTLLYTVAILYRDNINTNNYLRFPVLLYILPFLVGGGLQAVVPSLRLAGVSFALGIATTHLSVQRRLLYTDAMTGVFNRTYMGYFFKEACKKEKKVTISGLMIDINSFKEINDTLGHGAGDEAIKNAAKVLKKTAKSEYLVMRYGGDEFLLVKKYGTMEDLQAQKELINENLKVFNEESKLSYDLSFAIGTAVCEISQGSYDELLEQMDKSLYLDKKAFYESTGKERRK